MADKIIPELEAWRSRPLEGLYPIVYLDAIHFKVRENGRVVNKAMYNGLVVRTNGHKELLGLYLWENEGAKFWFSVLSDLQARGGEDILICCIDNLTGFSEAIESIFPKARVQLCIVHQIRNILRYVTHEDSKQVLNDLKAIYQSTSLEVAEDNLLELENKWKARYPILVRSWLKNWERLVTYFDFPKVIRKAIYTNNPIERYHGVAPRRQIRKHTKNKVDATRAYFRLIRQY